MSQAEEEATRYVSMWVMNDHDPYFMAQSMKDDPDAMGEYLAELLRNAPEGSAAWHTMRGLSANDLDAVDWAEIARDFTEEG